MSIRDGFVATRFFDALPLRCLSECGAPRGASRDPKTIVDTNRFALFGAPSPFTQRGELFDMTSGGNRGEAPNHAFIVMPAKAGIQ